MKKNIFLMAAVICFALATQAQETKTKGNDIRFMANNLANKSQNNFIDWLYYYDYYDLYDYGYYDFPNDLMNDRSYGLGYRHRSGKGALRLNLGFNYSTQKNDKMVNTNSNSLSKLKFSTSDICMGLGYQRDYVFDKVDLYWGFDAKFNMRMYNEGYTIIDNVYQGHYTDYTIKHSTTGMGAGPFIGVGYYITSKLSFSVETALDYSYEKIKSDYEDRPNWTSASTSTREDSRNYFKFIPLSCISLNVHL
jgi:hypothetical protein